MRRNHSKLLSEITRLIRENKADFEANGDCLLE